MSNAAVYVHVTDDDVITVQREERDAYHADPYFVVKFGSESAVFLTPDQMVKLADAMRSAGRPGDYTPFVSATSPGSDYL